MDKFTNKKLNVNIKCVFISSHKIISCISNQINNHNYH